jgi:hypothetical protein
MSLNNEPPESIRKLMEVADYLKYLMNHFVNYPVQRNDAGEALWEAIYNAWVRNNVACHLHVELEARGPHLHTHYLCVLVHKPVMAVASGNVQVNKFAPETLKELDKVGVPVGKHCYRGYHPVFVGVGELAEPRQGMRERMRFVETVAVGLMALDDCPVFGRDELAPAGVLQLLGRVGDRKLDSRLLPLVPWHFSVAIDERQLPKEVVEGGPEIVDGIPDKDSDPADGIFGECCCRPEDVIASVRFVFQPHGYLVNIGDRVSNSESRFAAKRIEVLFGPLDFSPDTGEVRLVARD